MWQQVFAGLCNVADHLQSQVAVISNFKTWTSWLWLQL
jgi:hypothetical protein